MLSDAEYVLAVSKDHTVVTKYFCLNFVDDCNWMKFVRLVEQPSQANLIVFPATRQCLFLDLQTCTSRRRVGGDLFDALRSNGRRGK